MSGQYILDERGEPQPEPDLLKWGRWLERADRIVAKTMVGTAEVSTVFLGLDHAFGGDAPILWETLIFGGPLDGEGDRYATRELAEAGHGEWVEKVRSSRA